LAAPGRVLPWWQKPMQDWRVWVGLGVTAVAIGVTLRGVDLREVGRALASANPIWLILMMPINVVALWSRSVRWRYLTVSLREDPISIGALFRATAVGFMTLNILPLRIGELARPWLLARETGVRGSAALGTVVLERAFDFTTIAMIGSGVLFFHTKALPTWVQSGAVVFALLACIPFLMVVGLRLREAATLAILARIFGFLPANVGAQLLEVVQELCRGITALKGARSMILVLAHSALLWGVITPAPFLLGLFAFGIDISPGDAILATYTAMVFTALAVAAPSAPGFFGVYHFACREALNLFGVSSAIAVAYGTAAHMCYWVPTTLVGLVCAIQTGARLADLAGAGVSKAPSSTHR
jgi:uncharacterized protein (TIRG00374 family)